MGCHLNSSSEQESSYFKYLISLKKINLYIFLYLNLVFFVLVILTENKIPIQFGLAGYFMLNLIAVIRYLFHKKWYREYESKCYVTCRAELSEFQIGQFKRSIFFFIITFVCLCFFLNFINETKTFKAVVEVAYLSFISSSIFFATHKCFEKK